MINYYEVLELNLDSKPDDIRRAFRRLAKKHHPDLNHHDPKTAEEHFRKIRDAFDTLINVETRRAYDQKLRTTLSKTQNTYPEILKKRKDDPQAQARLVLYHLLNENYHDAIENYEEQLRRDPNFTMEEFLDEKDWLDAEFLLGEAYEAVGNWRKALAFYESVYMQESDSPIRFFLLEVKERIRDIYCKKIARRCNPIESIDIYTKVMDMGFNKKTEAYLHKKIAEAYFKAKDSSKAIRHLNIAFNLEPKLKGAQKICEKLGVPYRMKAEIKRQAVGAFSN
jgi:curved DNA-binding protein CbpA